MEDTDMKQEGKNGIIRKRAGKATDNGPRSPRKAPRGNQTAEAGGPNPRKEEAPGKAIQERVFIGVSVDKELWRQLRARAVATGSRTGVLLDGALESFLALDK
jgi:hypothetical protein